MGSGRGVKTGPIPATDDRHRGATPRFITPREKPPDVPTIEVSIPEEVLSEFERLVEQEFVNRDEAIEQLLTAGVDAYTRDYEADEIDFAEEYADDMWDTAGGPNGSDGGQFGR